MTMTIPSTPSTDAEEKNLYSKLSFHLNPEFFSPNQLTCFLSGEHIPLAITEIQQLLNPISNYTTTFFRNERLLLVNLYPPAHFNTYTSKELYKIIIILKNAILTRFIAQPILTFNLPIPALIHNTAEAEEAENKNTQNLCEKLNQLVYSVLITHDIKTYLKTLKHTVLTPLSNDTSTAVGTSKELKNIQDKEVTVTYSIKVKRLGIPSHLSIPNQINFELRKTIGAYINRYLGWKATSTSPQLEFYGILTMERFWLLVVRQHTIRKQIYNKSPKDRPFVHPASMKPRFIYLFLNLAEITSKASLLTQPKKLLILDPFAGAAGFLYEILHLKQPLFPVGIELKRNLAFNALKNIKSAEKNTKKALIYINADSRFLPFKSNSFDAVITDPPYGTAATTAKTTPKELFCTVAKEIARVLKPGSPFVFAFPNTYNIKDCLSQIYIKIITTYDWYVHGKLTRTIYITKKEKIH